VEYVDQVTYNYQTRMDCDANLQGPGQLCAQPRDCRNNIETRTDRALGVIIMSDRIAEVCENAVTKKLRHVTGVVTNHIGAGSLILPRQMMQLFRIDLSREFR
jgi:hypothetical protein